MDKKLKEALEMDEELIALYGSGGFDLYTREEYEKDPLDREKLWSWKLREGEPFNALITLFKHADAEVKPK